MAEKTRKELELEQLQKNSPYSLPDDTALSKFTPQQIKEKFYAGLFYLYNLFYSMRDTTESDLSNQNDIIDEFTQKVDDFLELNQATRDSEGNIIKDTYAKIQALRTGTVAVLKYLKQDGTSANIYSDIVSLGNAIQSINALFTGSSATSAISSSKAQMDWLGRIIHTTYATASALASTDSEVAKIKNGTTIVPKATNDDENNPIKTTYVKKSQIVNNLTSTSTNAPLSAAQGKALKDALDTLSNYIYSGAANTSIDRLTEVFAFLTGHDDDETLDAILAGKVSIADLVDNLTTENTSKALTAKQGYVLKGLVDLKVAIADIVDNLTTEDATKPLSAKQGKALKALIDALDVAKADASAVYTKEGAEDMVDAKIAGIESVNVINDIPNNKNYDYQILLRADNEIVLRLTEVE